jgi:hypothetical protein
MIRLIIIALLAALPVRSELIPASRLIDFTPHTPEDSDGVGVPGGIDRFYPGGANERTTLLNVMDYGASGSVVETTGTITSGTNSLVVASAATFAVGQHIRVGHTEVQQLVINSGATSSGNLTLTLGMDASTSKSFSIAVLSGDTATQIADKIRASSASSGYKDIKGWAASGSGPTIALTRNTNRAVTAVASIATALGVTATGSVIQDGSIAFEGSITAIDGTTFTLSGNATASVTSATVSHNDTPAIVAAVTAANGTNSVVWLPAGDYRIDSEVATGAKSNYTIRGAGPASTRIQFHGTTGSAFAIGTNLNGQPLTEGNGNWGYYNFPITGNPVKGDNEITVGAAASTLQVGKLIMLDVLDDNTVPVLSIGGETNRNRKHFALITSKTATTVTIHPGLFFDLPETLSPRINTSDAITKYAGLEDLSVDGGYGVSSAQYTVSMGEAYGCWIRNIEVRNASNYNFGAGELARCEVRKSLFMGRIGTGSNGASVLIAVATGLLVEDCIVGFNSPGFEINFSTTGSVFAYNFGERIESNGVLSGFINANHGPHNVFNLFEGNYGARFQSDGYFGSASDNILFRNWFHGTSPVTTTNRWAITLNRLSSNFSVIGNLIGDPDEPVTWKLANAGPGFDATSSTSNTIASSGSKTFTVASGLSWEATFGKVLVRSISTPSAWMTGTVSSYSGTELTFTVVRSGGSGTYTDWTVVGGGGLGQDQGYIYALGHPNIGNGGVGGLGVVDPTAGVWWPVWDGRLMTKIGAYNSGTAYNSTTTAADVVLRTASAPTALTGGASVTSSTWVAANNAKSGLTTWDDPGPSSADWLPLGTSMFQELDYSVVRTLIRKGNRNARDDAIPADESLGADVAPASLYRSSKPAFLGDKPWPVFDATQPFASQSPLQLPAYHRYALENESYLTGEPPPSGGTATITTLNATTLNIQ